MRSRNLRSLGAGPQALNLGSATIFLSVYRGQLTLNYRQLKKTEVFHNVPKHAEICCRATLTKKSMTGELPASSKDQLQAPLGHLLPTD